MPRGGIITCCGERVWAGGGRVRRCWTRGAPGSEICTAVSDLYEPVCRNSVSLGKKGGAGWPARARRAGLPAPPGLRARGQRAYFADPRDMWFLPDGIADLVVARPPWSDGGSYAEYLDGLGLVWDECYRVAKPDAALVLNVGNRRRGAKYFPVGFDVYSRMRRWTLWDALVLHVPNAPPQPARRAERLFDDKYEFLLVFTKNGGRSHYKFHKPRVPAKYGHADRRKRKMNPRGRCLGNVIRIPRGPAGEPAGRPAPYEDLVSLVLHAMTDKGDLVLDPLMESGQTLKVAAAMHRKGAGVGRDAGRADAVRRKIAERFQAPDWKQLDIAHSGAARTPGAEAT